MCPALLRPLGSEAVDRLGAAVEARDPAAAGQAAIDVRAVAFDLQLRHRSTVEIDLARFDLWLAQIGSTQARQARATSRVTTSRSTTCATGSPHRWTPRLVVLVNTGLEELISAIGDGDSRPRWSQIAAELRDVIA